MDIGNDFLGSSLDLLPALVDVFQEMQISRGVNGGDRCHPMGFRDFQLMPMLDQDFLQNRGPFRNFRIGTSGSAREKETRSMFKLLVIKKSKHRVSMIDWKLVSSVKLGTLMNPLNSAFCDQGKTSCSCKQAPSHTIQTLFENRVAKLLTEPTGEPRIPQGIDHCKHPESGAENADLNQKI